MNSSLLTALQAVVDPNLPGRDDPVTVLFQFVFQRPPWVMWGGIILAAVIGMLLLWWLYRKLPVIRERFRQQPRLKLLAGVGLAAGLAIAVFAGAEAQHFMHSDKRFCTGCHVFIPAGHAMVPPDSIGHYKLVGLLEGDHEALQCTDCHHSSTPKQMRKMLRWISGIRDSTMDYHAPVSRESCDNCHARGDAKEAWEAIAATSGHRAHLQSDTIHLRSKAECLTCHAETAHRFEARDQTCTQQGCHLSDEVKINLGRMSGQTGFHCVLCHQFSREVPLLATTDSARTVLRRPGQMQCNQCHAMQQKLADFEPSRDPHNGSCGTCHNPHSNVKPEDALKSCADAGCHSDWKTVPFHNGAAHRRAAPQCESCHKPHQARVDASDCVGCHTTVRGMSPKGGRRLRPPATFDTSKALRSMSSHAAPPEREARGKGDVPPPEPLPGPGPGVADTTLPRPFQHERHTSLTCIKCHDIKSQTNFLRFKQPRGCLICHHQSPDKADCASCHAGIDAREFTGQFVVRTSGPPAHSRDATAPFAHATHASVACRDCHRESVTLAPTAEARSCQGCHDQHHDAGRDCATCHRVESSWQAHNRDTHFGCTACHATATVARLLPDRAFCLGCHAPENDHYAESACTTCHLFETPESFRPSLARAP